MINYVRITNNKDSFIIHLQAILWHLFLFTFLSQLLFFIFHDKNITYKHILEKIIRYYHFLICWETAIHFNWSKACLGYLCKVYNENILFNRMCKSCTIKQLWTFVTIFNYKYNNGCRHSCQHNQEHKCQFENA